ncbi:hypothetical protein DF182_21110 [Chitinophaga flava]|uniref:Uncharacterized protein n=1 Tax=Chitinophaga flava TaxID=2259036 RepID=A0A365XSC6_9BACT|nr:hypothetical protein DF182_21110 [Chitinophaga flava]
MHNGCFWSKSVAGPQHNIRLTITDFQYVMTNNKALGRTTKRNDEPLNNGTGRQDLWMKNVTVKDPCNSVSEC